MPSRLRTSPTGTSRLNTMPRQTRGVHSVVSSSSGGVALAVNPIPATITPTVVISGTASPSPTTLSVPMQGQADAPPTQTDVAIVAAAGGGNGAPNLSGGNGAAGGNGLPKVVADVLPKTKHQWLWLAALGVGVYMIARK